MARCENSRSYKTKAASGFSLIELMIAVAIISVLATIAVPNYLKFVAKARQTEAKVNLSTIYAGEKAFHAEWGGYTGDFRDIGVSLSGKLRYDVGFANAGWSPGTIYTHISSAYCGPRLAYNTEVSFCTLEPGSSQAKVLFQPAVARGPCGAGLAPTMNEFRVTAVGQIGGNSNDVWTIDHNRVLCNNQPGL